CSPVSYLLCITMVMTGSVVSLPSSTAVISQGPSMPWPGNGSWTVPLLSRTIRQPAPDTLPFLVGSEPTITQPLGSTLSAVVRPTPPGQAPPRLPILANCDTWPSGVTWTIVVPVPCTLA